MVNFFISVLTLSEWDNSAHIGRILIKFDIVPVYDIRWKNMVQPNRPQMTVQSGACTFHVA